VVVGPWLNHNTRVLTVGNARSCPVVQTTRVNTPIYVGWQTDGQFSRGAFKWLSCARRAIIRGRAARRTGAAIP